MSSLHDQLNEKSTQTEQLEEHVAELQGNIEKKKIEIIRWVRIVENRNILMCGNTNPERGSFYSASSTGLSYIFFNAKSETGSEQKGASGSW